MADLMENLPPALQSLWNLENELRSALQNAILLRKDEAGKHMDSAKVHLERALQELKLGGKGEVGASAPYVAPQKANEGSPSALNESTVAFPDEASKS